MSDKHQRNANRSGGEQCDRRYANCEMRNINNKRLSCASPVMFKWVGWLAWQCTANACTFAFSSSLKSIPLSTLYACLAIGQLFRVSDQKNYAHFEIGAVWSAYARCTARWRDWWRLLRARRAHTTLLSTVCLLFAVSQFFWTICKMVMREMIKIKLF